MASSSSKKRDGGRRHLRLPPKLKREIERYARDNDTTVTAVTIRALKNILSVPAPRYDGGVLLRDEVV